MVIDPVTNFLSDIGSSTATVATFTATSALRAIQEVLLQAVTDVGAKLRASTANDAGLLVAGVCIVGTRRVCSQSRLALLVSAGALSARALQSITAIGAIFGSLVSGAVRRITRAGLLGIAIASRFAANGTGGSKLAAATTIFV